MQDDNLDVGSDKITWNFSRQAGKIGTGNWDAFPAEQVCLVLEAAEAWKDAMASVPRPWLCWCVDEDWCLVQQRLVAAVGWTPVVGTDGRVPTPRTIPGALFVDFNARLQLPVMWMHFVLDFVHCFCEKLAFWHSDVLPPVPIMEKIAGQFESIEDGQLVAVKRYKATLGDVIRRLRKRRPPFYKRWFEVVGCTTAGASDDLFENGCGWWRTFHLHPNAQESVRRAKFHWEHGVGIWLWHTRFGGRAHDLCVNIFPYHYSAGHPLYDRRHDQDGRLADSKRTELRRSFDLAAIVSNLGLDLSSDAHG